MDDTINKKKGKQIQTAMGGRIVHGRHISPDSPVAQTLMKCANCPIRKRCERYDKKGRCFYQIRNLKAEYKMQSALTSGEPLDLLRDIQATVARLESVIRYNEMVGEQPKKNDLKELAFLKLQIYEMVYGRSKPVAAVQVNAPMVNVKEMMDELRKGKESDMEEVKENDNS